MGTQRSAHKGLVTDEHCTRNYQRPFARNSLDTVATHTSSSMEDYRPDAAKDIKDFQQVSLKYYESCILPASVYSNHVDAITKALEDNDVLKKLDDEKRLRWADFLNDPKDNGSGEDETFKSMATVAAAIVKAAQEVLSEGPKPTTVMECKPHEVAISEGRNSGFKSDGHYKLLQSGRPDYVENATSTTPIKPPASIKLNAVSSLYFYPSSSC